jgi:hypothetical protein
MGERPDSVPLLPGAITGTFPGGRSTGAGEGEAPLVIGWGMAADETPPSLSEPEVGTAARSGADRPRTGAELPVSADTGSSAVVGTSELSSTVRRSPGWTTGGRAGAVVVGAGSERTSRDGRSEPRTSMAMSPRPTRAKAYSARLMRWARDRADALA